MTFQTTNYFDLTRQDGTHTAANEELVVSDGGTITAPTPTAGETFGVRALRNDVTLVANSSIEGSTIDRRITSEGNAVFVSDGTEWYLVSGEEHFGFDIPDSGISHYELEDSSQTNTLVDSWASNNGSLNNGTYVTGGIEFANQSDNYGTLPNAAFNFSGSFSVAIRFSVPSEFGSSGANTVSRQSHIGSRDGDSGEEFSIEHRDGNVEMDYFDGTTAADVSNSTDLRDGNEHLLVMAFGTSQIEGFQDDGNSIGTSSYDGDLNNTDSVGLARRGGGGGQIRQGPMTAFDVQTFDKRLSSSEVSNLWQTGSIDG